MKDPQAEWENNLSREIWQEIRTRLYLSARYLDAALVALPPVPDRRFTGVATDGARLVYPPEHALRLFEQNPNLLCREYLHLALHCIFRHLFQTEGQDPRLWGLCCDIAVEAVIDSLPCPHTRRALTYTRAETYRRLREKCGTLAAGPICRHYAQNGLSEQEYARLEAEFRTDDHSLWPWDAPHSAAVQQLAQQWKKRAGSMQADLSSFSRGQPGEGDELSAQLADAAMPRRSYREFLRRFCILREELHPDPDSFDPGYYAYGLSLYGNLPLIEPQESREAFKVQELAIVIDTSMSCSGELVRRFLQETFSILRETESFFHKVHLRILQCDNEIRADAAVTCEEEMESYLDNLQLKGGGGTDFRPAFTYLDYLCRRHAFHKLAGVLYFTDGMGRYPKQRPPWPTAFLFLEGQYDNSALPAWAMKQVLYPDQWRAAPLQERKFDQV